MCTVVVGMLTCGPVYHIPLMFTMFTILPPVADIASDHICMSICLCVCPCTCVCVSVLFWLYLCESLALETLFLVCSYV